MTIKSDEKGVTEQDPASKGDGSQGAADPKDKMVPVSVLEATRADLKGQIARLVGEVESLKAGSPSKTAEPEKVFTRAQLNASVASGDITQDQADELFEAQLEKKLTAKIKTETVSTVGAAEQSRTVQGKIDGYVDAYPDLVKEDSDLRAKVQVEFDELVSLGDSPKDVATQLKAIRAVCGPLKAKGRKAAPDTFDDTGGTGDNGEKPDTAGWAKGLGATQKKHYQKLIDRGIYKGASDPKLLSELKLVRKAH